MNYIKQEVEYKRNESWINFLIECKVKTKYIVDQSNTLKIQYERIHCISIRINIRVIDLIHSMYVVSFLYFYSVRSYDMWSCFFNFKQFIYLATRRKNSMTFFYMHRLYFKFTLKTKDRQAKYLLRFITKPLRYHSFIINEELIKIL